MSFILAVIVVLAVAGATFAAKRQYKRSRPNF
jgi:hypothetical protein